MNILVIGAGVLGSLLSHTLIKGGNNVTLLARGKRKAELEENGLVIRHYLQMRTTRDRLKLTDTFAQEDDYDIVFVVTRRNQLDDLLPQISANVSSGLFVIMGNNLAAPQTYQQITKTTSAPKAVLFGFQGSGGRRQDGRVISIHNGLTTHSGRITLGSLDGDEHGYALLVRAFEHTKMKLLFNTNIDAWLKCHAAFITCMLCGLPFGWRSEEGRPRQSVSESSHRLYRRSLSNADGLRCAHAATRQLRLRT
jgi:2-dehydropantoate 2-reductase